MTLDTRSLASDLSLAVVRLSRHLRGRRADSAVSLTQLSALASLDEHGPMTPGGLAAKERVQPPSMTRVIASLAEAGLVARTPHPTDGRQIIVSLTGPGQALLADETSAREKWMTDRLASLDDEDLDVLRRSIGILGGFVNGTD